MRRVVIDADSILYQACFTTSCEELPECDTEGVYTIGMQRGSSQGEEGSMEVVDTMDITAVDKKHAMAQYYVAKGVCAYAVVVNFVSDAEDLGLDEVDIALEAKRAFTSRVNTIMNAVSKRYKDLNPIPTIVITVKEAHTVCDGMAGNYRYHVMDGITDVKGYKHNRKELEPPKGLDELYEWVFKQDDTICKSGIEADDYCVWAGHEGDLVCAIDKDVLYNVPEAYNYGRKEWVTSTEKERRHWFYTQCITGDSSDGIRGVYRVGAVGAEKALKRCVTDIEYWTAVVTTYFTKGQTLEEAIATARCVDMMGYDGSKHTLWQPPKRK